MRILHVFDHSIPLHSGYTFRSLAIIREQRKLGFETLHLTSPKHFAYQGAELEEEVGGYHFYRSQLKNTLLDKIPLMNQWSVVSATKKRISQVLLKEKINIIQAHSPCLNGLAALLAAKKHRIPIVYEMRASWEDAAVDHGTCKEKDLRYRMSRLLETYVLKRADAITTICEGLKNDIIIRGIEEKKITVIPNAVDIERFTMNGKKDLLLNDQLKLTGNTVLGFIGSFYQYEGLELLIDAFPEILKKHNKTKLLLVGGGIQEAFLQEKAKKLGMQDQIIFAGRVPHEEVQKYYNLIDIFVYPRLPMRLTNLVTPLKPLEAMAEGRLVIASDVGGHQELITDGENGLLFRAGDKNSLVNRVMQLINNKDEWMKYKKAGLKYVREQRNWKVSISRYTKVFHNLH